MELVDQLRLSRASAVLQKQIRKFGQVPSMGRDFYHFKSLIDDLDDRELSDQFNIEHETLLPNAAFWIVCRDFDGRLIAAIAAKLEDLGSMCAADYWQMQHPRVYRFNAGGSIEFEPEQSRRSQAMRGRLVYLGDMWVRQDHRKKGLCQAVAKLAMIAALPMWHYDYIYAFVHNDGMKSALGPSCGFCGQQDIAIKWKSNPPQLLRSNWLCWSQQIDVLDMIDRLADQADSEGIES